MKNHSWNSDELFTHYFLFLNNKIKTLLLSFLQMSTKEKQSQVKASFFLFQVVFLFSLLGFKFYQKIFKNRDTKK